MKDLFAVAKGNNCAANQVLYNLEHRGVQFDLAAWCDQKKIPIMAYSPLGQGHGLLTNSTLTKVAKRHSASAAQIALAWLLHQHNVITIPKATREEHVRDNARSIDIQLDKNDLEDLDKEFPPPKSKQSLSMA